MSWTDEVRKARSRSAFARHGIITEADAKKKTLEYNRKAAIKGIEDQHKKDIAGVKEWEKSEMQMEAERLADEIVGLQR